MLQEKENKERALKLINLINYNFTFIYKKGNDLSFSSFPLRVSVCCMWACAQSLL